MRALLIKPVGLCVPWTDTGVRTTTPDREVAAMRRRNPGCLVMAVDESAVEKTTRPADGS